MKEITLPKGTIVKIKGFPCELADDTTVFSNALTSMWPEVLADSPQTGDGTTEAQPIVTFHSHGEVEHLAKPLVVEWNE